MGGKEKEGRVGGRGKGKGGEGKGERMWRGPESGLPRGPCWLSAGLQVATVAMKTTHFPPNLFRTARYSKLFNVWSIEN